MLQVAISTRFSMITRIQIGKYASDAQCLCSRRYIHLHSVGDSQDINYSKKYRPCRSKRDRRRTNFDVSIICLCAKFRCHEVECLPACLLTTNLVTKLVDQLLSHIHPTVSSSRSHMGGTSPDVDRRRSRGEILVFLAPHSVIIPILSIFIEAFLD